MSYLFYKHYDPESDDDTLTYLEFEGGGTKYYPIDMDKIITLTLKGGLRKRKRKYNIKSYKKQKKQRKKKSKTKKSNL